MNRRPLEAAAAQIAEMILAVIEPMKLSVAAPPFDDPDFPFELKHDGLRAIAS